MHVKFTLANLGSRERDYRLLRARIEEWIGLHNIQGAWLTYTGRGVVALTFTNESDCSMFVISWSGFDEVPWRVEG